MPDIKVLEASGYDPEKLRKAFLPEGGESARSDGVKRLLDLAATRIHEGVNRNLRNARWYWAIDQACDVSQNQISLTLAKGLIGRAKMDREQINNVVNDWGLTSMLQPVIDPQTGKARVDSIGRVMTNLELPVFNKVEIPLCPQYLEVRWATLIDQRDQSPFLKFQPQVFSREGHLKSELVTSRIERMTQDMGYRSDFRQEVLMMLKYGAAFAFAREPYFRDVQLRAIQNDSGDKVVYDPVVVREGVRFDYPHPSRAFIDLSHRAQTLNTNTGVAYVGYWDIYRYGDIIENKRYWLSEEERKEGKDVGSMAWVESASWDIYSRLYPCTIEMPSEVFGGSTQRSALDRTSEAFRYTYSQRDNGVVLTKIYMKIVPKNYGLFEYKGSVWFCFTMINDRTPILVEPYCYTPARICQYNADQGLWRNSSLVNVILPFQDQLGNLMSQYLLSVRRNLVNLVWYNKDAVSQAVIDKLERLGKELYTDINFVPISFREMSYEPTAGEPQNLFRPVQFGVVPTDDLIRAVNSLLDQVERAIGFTAQEVGTVAQHVQTAEEVKTIRGYQNSRIVLTDTFVDSSIQAWKDQLYRALMAYGDDIIMAEVADMNDLNPDDLERLGFTVELSPDRRAGVMGPKASLTMMGFASDREGTRRTDDAQLSNSLMQFAQTVFSVPQVVEAMGIEGIIDMFNTVSAFAGLPPEARIRAPNQQEQAMQALQKVAQAQQEGGGEPPAPQGPPPELLQQIQQGVAQMMEAEMEKMGQVIKTQVVEPMSAAIQQTQAVAMEANQRSIALETVVKQMIEELGQFTQQVAQPPVPPPMPIPMV